MPYVELTGVNLWYTDTGGMGLPVIFLHAASGTHESWIYQEPVFTAAGYRCICYDRRSWGRSQTVASDGDPGNVSDDLHGLADQLGLERFHLVATAAGGTAGLDYTLSYPEGVRSLVIATTIGGVEDPEYLDVLYRGFYNDLRGEGPTGDVNELTVNRVPVYSYHAGRVSCSYNYRMIENATVKSGIPLTDEERHALDFVREVADREDLSYRFSLRPGDIQMISNHSAFHSRTSFVDHDEPDKKRCLLRFWMNIRDGRALEESFAARYNTGPRGGVAVGDGARYVF